MTDTNWGRQLNVLFLCDTNCGRSLIAQAILERESEGRFRAFSAGAHPAAAANPVAIDLLQKLGHETAGLHPKSWDDFAHESAPEMDFIFTLFDEHSLETAPAFPGVPITSNWNIQTASRTQGNDAVRYAAFDETYAEILRLVHAFTSLPFKSLDSGSLHARVREIGAGG